MKFLTKGEAEIERNLLRVYEVIYPAAVRAVATALRPRFESGELRGWVSGDGDLPKRQRPPFWKLESECVRRFITSPVRALGVLACSPSVRTADADGFALVEPWHWDAAGSGTCLLGAAEAAMAYDVLRFARECGWSRPRRGEERMLTKKPQARRAA
jgi:hypothetical protein